MKRLLVVLIALLLASCGTTTNSSIAGCYSYVEGDIPQIRITELEQRYFVSVWQNNDWVTLYDVFAEASPEQIRYYMGDQADKIERGYALPRSPVGLFIPKAGETITVQDRQMDAPYYIAFYEYFGTGYQSDCRAGLFN
jgi:hypothetical protein